MTGSTGGRRGACSAFLLVLVLLLSCSGCKPPEEATVKAIVGAVLIDGSGGPPVSNSIVLISGPKIAAALPRTAFPIPQGTEEIDGSGKYIIPSLIDVYLRTGDTVTAKAGGATLQAGLIGDQASPEEARRLISQSASAGRYMAVLDRPQPAAEEAALEEARKNKLPVFAGVSKLADAQRLLAGGVAGFIGMITDTDQIDRALFVKMRDLRVIWVPALVDQPAGALAMAKRNTMQLASAGVPIAVGGATIEREMELLVEAGLSPGDVIVAATRNGALVVGKSLELGTLQPRKYANLVMLPKNPIEDIRNLRSGGREMQEGAWK